MFRQVSGLQYGHSRCAQREGFKRHEAVRSTSRRAWSLRSAGPAMGPWGLLGGRDSPEQSACQDAKIQCQLLQSRSHGVPMSCGRTKGPTSPSSATLQILRQNYLSALCNTKGHSVGRRPWPCAPFPIGHGAKRGHGQQGVASAATQNIRQCPCGKPRSCTSW